MSAHYFPHGPEAGLIDGYFSKPAFQLVPKLEEIMNGTERSDDRSLPNDPF
jgi:hypothetical protein